MSRFTIDWRRTALEELADAWTVAPNRNAVTAAFDAIERKLSENPQGNAGGCVERLYFLAEPPLRVGFTIDETSRTVTVVGLGVYQAR
jgi:hypothetical protein